MENDVQTTIPSNPELQKKEPAINGSNGNNKGNAIQWIAQMKETVMPSLSIFSHKIAFIYTSK